MSTAAASILFLCLLTVAMAYALWAIGSKWPIRDPQLLANAVIGRPGVTHVPRLTAFLLAVLLMIAAVIGTSLGDVASGGLPLTLAGAALAALFAARGIAGYLPAWQARHPVEPFAMLNRRAYSPMCLVVALCFIVLVVARLT